jgi:hypothetical protein
MGAWSGRGTCRQAGGPDTAPPVVSSSRFVNSRQPARDGLAAAFAHPGVADAYQYRPPYPPDMFDVLEQFITDPARTGRRRRRGEDADPLATRVDPRRRAGRLRGDGRRPRTESAIFEAAETAEIAARTHS